MFKFSATVLFLLVSAQIHASSLNFGEARIYSQFRDIEQYDLASQPESNDGVGVALGTGDFNGDGYQDLAIGNPQEDLGSGSSALRDSGWVSVLYGSARGLDASRGVEDTWDQQGAIEGGAESGDRVGQAVAIGDFNGDGFDDLAMGAPGEDIGSTGNAGAVNVIYGSANGLTETANRIFYQGRELDGFTVPPSAEFGDNLGRALAAGDFDGDGNDDLAIGVPFEDINSANQNNAGGIIVLYGQPVLGLGARRAQGITRDSAGMVRPALAGDNFGRSLAAGDLNGDGRDDLAVGVPDDYHGLSDVGAVDLIFGSPNGLDPQTNRALFLHQIGVGQLRQEGDHFGFALTMGNFDGDSYADLAVGIPNRETDGLDNSGAVAVLYGSAAGIDDSRSQYLIEGGAGLGGTRSAGDLFGYGLTAGDLNGDGADELMVGVLGEQAFVNGAAVPSAGAVRIVPGKRNSGLTVAQSSVVNYQVFGEPRTDDYFGAFLAAGDFNGDRADDLVTSAVGREVPDSSGNQISNAGEVFVIPGVFDSGPCVATQHRLCLSANRFRVQVQWGSNGVVTPGVAIPRTADTGFFWFFNQENIELVVKVLDARGVNGHFWVFYGSLSDVAYTLQVIDEETGQIRTYQNPRGTFASAGDTTAFRDSGAGLTPTNTDQLVHGSFPIVFDDAEPRFTPEQITERMSNCQANQLSLCLNNERFFVQVNWRDFQGNTGNGQAVPLTNDTGAFWFFEETNLELVLKVLDGTDINGHYWIYFGALTNIRYEITVLDTETGRTARYVNPANRFASEGDTTALGQ